MDNQKTLIETAINADEYLEAAAAIEDIKQEGLVEVAIRAKKPNHAMMALNKILRGNQDLLLEVAKNAEDMEVALSAARKIRKNNPDAFFDIEQNASHEEVRDFAKDKIAGKKPDFKEKSANKSLTNKLSSKKEPIQESDDKIEIIQNQKVQGKVNTHYESEHEKQKRIKEKNEFLDMFKNDAVYDFIKIMFDRAGRDNQKAFVLIAKNAYVSNVAIAALERIDYDNNQKGLSDIARNSYGIKVAELALEKIHIKNQKILSDIARNSNHLGVQIEALSRLSGDYYRWAQKKLVDIAKNAYDEDLALRALKKIRHNEDGLFDVAKNSEYDSVAVAAFGYINTDQSGLIDLAKNANGLPVSRSAFDKISTIDSNVWVDIANNAKREYIAKKAFEKIDEDNQNGLAEVAMNSKHDSLVRKALGMLGNETLDENPYLKERKLKITQDEYKGYKYNHSYGSNANSTAREKFFR